MYVHCHDCKWEQDDFYSIDGYNPAKFLADNYNKDLFGLDIDKLTVCREFKNGIPVYPDMTVREIIASHYEAFAYRIRSMKWITVEDFYNDPNKVCPRCGSENLDTD